MGKFTLAVWIKVGILVLSVTLWAYLALVATFLRPVADEICVLGEMQSGDSFPPFHTSPRVLASLFTWASSMLWVNNYAMAILLQWLMISFLISINVRELYKVFSIEISKSQAQIFGLVITPFFILFLPPKNQAIYDTFYWFGGSWHTIGALLVMYVALKAINPKTELPLLISLIVFGSLWSEVTSIFIAVAVGVSTIFYKSKRIFLVLIPSLSILLHAYVSLNTGRIQTSNGPEQNFMDLNTFKGLVLMYLLLSSHGIVIAAIANFWFSSTEKMRPFKINKLQRTTALTLIAVGSAFFLASALTYATWRSTIVFGVTGFGLGIILWQGILRKMLISRIISSILLAVTIFSNTGGMIPMLNILEIRKNWWEANNSAKWINISKNNLSQGEQIAIPADWGKGEWVDGCYLELTGASK